MRRRQSARTGSGGLEKRRDRWYNLKNGKRIGCQKGAPAEGRRQLPCVKGTPAIRRTSSTGCCWKPPRRDGGRHLADRQEGLLFDVAQSFEPLLAAEEEEEERRRLAGELRQLAERTNEISKTNHTLAEQLLEELEEHLGLPKDPKARLRLSRHHALERLKITSLAGRCGDEAKYFNTLAEIEKIGLLAESSDRIRFSREAALTDPAFERKIWHVRRLEIDAGLLEAFVERQMRMAQACELAVFAEGDERKIERISYEYAVGLEEAAESELEDLEFFRVEEPGHSKFFSADLNNLIDDIKLLDSLLR